MPPYVQHPIEPRHPDDLGNLLTDVLQDQVTLGFRESPIQCDQAAQGGTRDPLDLAEIEAKLERDAEVNDAVGYRVSMCSSRPVTSRRMVVGCMLQWAAAAYRP
jgi:hypothetical protein